MRNDARFQDEQPKVIAIAATREAAGTSIMHAAALAAAIYTAVGLLLHVLAV